MNFRYILMLLALVSYGLNAMQKFDNLEALDKHLQQLKGPELHPYHVGGYVFNATAFYGFDSVQACDWWAYKTESKFSAAKVLRWNNPDKKFEHDNKQKPNSNQNRNNKATDLIHSIVLPAQTGQPGFFTIKNLTANEGWFEDGSLSQGTIQIYQRTEHKKWEDRHWFTVSEMQSNVTETATLDYKPREAQNFTSLEVTVTENEPKNVKVTQTRLNKTTCMSLLVGAVGAWLTWSHWRK